MDSLRASNIEKPLFKITKIKSPINSLSQTNQPTLNDQTITSDSDTLSSVFSEKTFHSGKWSKLENLLFLEGVLNYGNDWKKIQENIGTRKTTQARSHAQKIFLKLQSKNIVKIDNHVNTIQEFFKVLKKFPSEDFKKIYHQIIEITNEKYKTKNIRNKRLPKKRKIFVVIHNISNNNDMKNISGIEGVNDKTEGTFNSTSSYKKEDDDCIEELLSQNDVIDINKQILNENNEIDVFFSHL